MNTFKNIRQLFIFFLFIFLVLFVKGYSQVSKGTSYFHQREPKVDKSNYYKAEELFLFGKPKAALKVARRYVIAHPKDPEGYFLLFRVQKRLGNFEEAEKNIKKAKKLSPSVKYVIAYSQFLYERRRFKEALPLLEFLVKEGEKGSYIYRHIAECYYNLGDSEKALQASLYAIKEEPKDYKSYILLGKIYDSMGDKKKAIKSYEDGIKKGCQDKYVFYSLADLYEDEGNPAKAIQVYRKLLKVHPKEREAYRQICRIYRQEGKWLESVRAWLKYVEGGANFSFIQSLFIGILVILVSIYFVFPLLFSVLLIPIIFLFAALKKKKWLRKISDFSSLYAFDWAVFLCNYAIVMIDEEDASGWNMMGKFYDGRGRYKKARKCYEKALTIDPNFSDAWFSLGIIHEKEKKFKDAEIAFKKALQQDENDFIAWHYLAHTYSRQEMYVEAWEAAKESLQLFSELNPSLEIFVETTLLLGKIDEGVEFLQGMLNRHPNSVALCMEIGNILFISGSPQRAAEYFKRAKEFSSNHFALHHFGVCYREMDKFEEAIKCIEEAISQSRDNGFMYVSLALTYMKQGDFDKAEDILKKVLEISPISSAANYFMGKILKKQNRGNWKRFFEKSILFLEREIKESLNPVRPWELANEYECLGISYMALGNIEKAVESFQKAKKYAYVSPERIFIFSEDQLKLVTKKEFIVEVERKVGSIAKG